MSNKIVPNVYRSIVDDVMSSIASEFEEFGVEQRVLTDLQSRWELKILNSHVAEFETPAAANHGNGSHHSDRLQYPAVAAPALPGPPQSGVRYHPSEHIPPPLAGPPPVQYHRGNGPPGGLALPSGYGMNNDPNMARRIPQVDGPSNSSQSESSSVGSPSPPPSKNLASGSREKPQDPDDETIGSDLDDSDDDDNLAGDNADITGGVQDIMFCTYDKVQRVKAKWKVVLKDGMVHLNGKDYLFSKCSGEFEW